MENGDRPETPPAGRLLLDIDRLYSKNKLPLINGVITEDKYLKITINGTKMELIEGAFDKSVLSSKEYRGSITIVNTLMYKKNFIHYGKGGSGNGSFIAIVDINSHILKWIMFHERINSIKQIEIGKTKIAGIDNNNIKYEFEINWEDYA